MPELDTDRLLGDVSRLVRIPSLTGLEHEAIEAFGHIASELGLDVAAVEHDLAEVRAAPGAPGFVAPRQRLAGVAATLRGSGASPLRLCIDGHLDVVPPGTREWRHGPWSGLVADGQVHGRGSVDMKGPLVAALHGVVAEATARGPFPGDIVVLGVSSEEDGGMGTFAALERDDDFAACVIPEPTGFDVVRGHAGAQQFSIRISGTSAHAGARLVGRSALDGAVAVLAALREHERRVNEEPRHELLRDVPLPYPISLGSIHGGQWPSQVIDEARLEGRLGVRMDETLAGARVALEQTLRSSFAEAPEHVSIEWTGSFEPSLLEADDRLVGLGVAAAQRVLGRDVRVSGVPWGADMYLFRRRGIPCVMLGPPSIERAHAVDEAAEVADLVTTARIFGELARSFWQAEPEPPVVTSPAPQ